MKQNLKCGNAESISTVVVSMGMLLEQQNRLKVWDSERTRKQSKWSKKGKI